MDQPSQNSPGHVNSEYLQRLSIHGQYQNQPHAKAVLLTYSPFEDGIFRDVQICLNVCGKRAVQASEPSTSKHTKKRSSGNLISLQSQNKIF
jgi:hypothetical protein